MRYVLISGEKGSVTAYALDKLQDRGRFFIEPGDEIYEGQIIGENIRPDDMVVNTIISATYTSVLLVPMNYLMFGIFLNQTVVKLQLQLILLVQIIVLLIYMFGKSYLVFFVFLF